MSELGKGLRTAYREGFAPATAQERRPRGATPRPRSGAAAERSYPTPEVRGPAPEEPPHLQGAAAAPAQEGGYSTFKVRRAVRRYPSSKVRSGYEERPHVQGEINPHKTVGVERGRQRADTLTPSSQETRQSDPRTTALSNSVRLSQAVWGRPRRSGHGGETRMWSTGREWQTTSVFLP